MKRTLALGLCLALLCPAARAAEETKGWGRSGPGGDYVTLRVPCPQEEAPDRSEQTLLAVRYVDAGESVPLTSDYQQGWLFAIVPTAEAERPLEVFQGEEHRFPNCIIVWKGHEYCNDPSGAKELYLWGVIQGDHTGNLNPDATLTWAEAFALVCRLLSLEPGGDPGCADAEPGDRYHDTVSIARIDGLAVGDAYFHLDRLVIRGELTVMAARVMKAAGWLTIPEGGTAAELILVDAGEILDWALVFCLVSDRQGLGILTQWSIGEIDPVYGEPGVEEPAEWDRPATRGEAITLLDDVRTRLSWYPTQAAIDWGSDETMPIVDGSTSTHPHTRTVYGALFWNYDNHPQSPENHSKNHESCEWPINGEADTLFTATPPLEELKAQAEAAGVELEYIPIVYDAMVFFTNMENSVTELTQKQIQGVYVYGKYTNWNQIGSPDAELLPYRCNTDSGSHALMEQYFLEGGKFFLSPGVYNVLASYTMSSALTDVARIMIINPLTYVMGYSVYYYHVNSYWLLGDAGGGEFKLLAVDRVLPSDETIVGGSYPLARYNYLVLRASEPEDAPARRLAKFMVSEADQTCVGSVGSGPLSSGPQADFQREQPNQSVDAIFPTGPGYVILSRDETHTTLRVSGLERNRMDGRWYELIASERLVPKSGKLSTARLGSGGGTVIFDVMGGRQGDSPTVRLTYGGGQGLTQRVYPGQVFHFLLEGSPAPEKLELLQGRQVLDGCTGFLQ